MLASRFFKRTFTPLAMMDGGRLLVGSDAVPAIPGKVFKQASAPAQATMAGTVKPASGVVLSKTKMRENGVPVRPAALTGVTVRL